jgi:hypothetical protein
VIGNDRVHENRIFPDALARFVKVTKPIPIATSSAVTRMTVFFPMDIKEPLLCTAPTDHF